MKLPNNYGSISKLSGNRRRPYIVRKHIGNSKYLIIGYYSTKEEALSALVEYNNTKPTINSVTLGHVYNAWFPQHSSLVGKSAIQSYQNAYRHIIRLISMPIANITYKQLQNTLNTMQQQGLSYSSRKKVKSLLSMLFKFAMINDWIQKDYTPYLQLGKDEHPYPRKPFTRQQINRVWASNLNTDGTLILLYTGLRCGEMLSLTKKDINLKSKYLIVRNSKTEAGRNRIIPIHKRIYPIIERLYHATNNRLIPLTYAQFRGIFKHLMTSINTEHSTHDCRHTVASLLDKYGANPTATRSILGHKNGDVTIRIYTHKSISDLRKAINLLP